MEEIQRVVFGVLVQQGARCWCTALQDVLCTQTSGTSPVDTSSLARALTPPCGGNSPRSLAFLCAAVDRVT